MCVGFGSARHRLRLITNIPVFTVSSLCKESFFNFAVNNYIYNYIYIIIADFRSKVTRALESIALFVSTRTVEVMSVCSRFGSNYKAVCMVIGCARL